jgi:hypothetical protein
VEADDYPNHQPVVDESYRLPAHIRAQLHFTITQDYEAARRALPPAKPDPTTGKPRQHESPFDEINFAVP